VTFYVPKKLVAYASLASSYSHSIAFDRARTLLRQGRGLIKPMIQNTWNSCVRAAVQILMAKTKTSSDEGLAMESVMVVPTGIEPVLPT
jgi:hypothetical protein